MLEKKFVGILCDEGRTTGQELVEHDTDRIEIGSLIACVPADRFGRDVQRSG